MLELEWAKLQASRLSRLGRSHPWLGVILVAAALFSMRIGMPLTDGDTAFYARIAQNVVESGNWQTLRFKDYPLVDKPPLTIWLIALSYLVFGINEFAIRCWHVGMAVGTLMLTYSTAHLFLSKRTATLSAWILLSCALFSYSAMVPQQDLPLTFFAGLALYGMARFWRGDGWVHIYTFWVALALGLLARGLQAFVFPIAVVGITMLLSFRKGPGWQSLKPWPRTLMHLGVGFMLCVLIAAPWFVLEHKEHGALFFDTFFGAGNARFMSSPNQEANWLHFFSYIPLLLVAFLPWSGLIGHALWWAGRGAFRRDVVSETENPLERAGITFFLVWFLVAFGMPFVIHWRVIRYLLPAMPPLAILVAHYLIQVLVPEGNERVGRGVRFAGLLGVIVVFPVLLLTAMVLARALPQEQIPYVPLVLPWLLTLATSLLLFAVAGQLRRYQLAVGGLIVGGIVTVAVLFCALQGLMVEILPWKEAATIVNASVSGVERVVWADGGDNWFLDFYIDHPVDRATEVCGDPEAFAGAWVVGTQSGMEGLRVGGTDVHEMWRRGDVRVARVGR